jgi:tryptophan halogenase
MALPDALAHKIELFRNRGRVARYDGQLFMEPSWVAVFLGQGIWPKAYDPLADLADLQELRRTLAHIRDFNRQVVSGMPTHERFIGANCKAPELALSA